MPETDYECRMCFGMWYPNATEPREECRWCHGTGRIAEKKLYKYSFGRELPVVTKIFIEATDPCHAFEIVQRLTTGAWVEAEGLVMGPEKGDIIYRESGLAGFALSPTCETQGEWEVVE